MSEVSELPFSVRDYECDLQGVVNNSVYLNYLEHARHVFLKEQQIDFAALSKAGINLVVIRAELDYKGSLTSGDSFIVRTRFTRKSRLKFLFIQDIIREGDEKVLLSAEVTGTAVNSQGKPFMPEELANLLE
ncbi:MAG: 4-hydroxybenzoyl-CoA thioesterase [SAR86 cluster bacterium]|uniref:4-hydroxybenzoyl-CoA thioesterase n=1 Tax=SAR86 cluster bacterium TaxID=2030880 RepID=A0A2A5CGR5_9GAMM|nr:MAG: 4-hydroxybenzoyl-CoA thioesterase [SAR86 cluster bacterium]